MSSKIVVIEKEKIYEKYYNVNNQEQKTKDKHNYP